MVYPVIGAYRLGDKVRIEADGVLREGEIICIGLNGYVVAADSCVFIVNDSQVKWCARTSGDEIKVGDRVKFKSEEEIVEVAGECFRYTANLLADKVATIESVRNGVYGIFDGHIRGLTREMFDKFTEEENKPQDNTLVIPVKVDLDDTYWDVYRAELAAKIAVAYAEKGRYGPNEIGEYAVAIAEEMVEKLQYKSHD